MAGKRNRNETGGKSVLADSPKKAKIEEERPKSRKELRAERKLAAKLVEDAPQPDDVQPKRLSKEEYKKQKQELRKMERKELRREEIKLQRKLKKERKHKKPKKKDSSSSTSTIGDVQQTKTEDQSITPLNDDQVNKKILDELIYGKSDETSGMTTLPMGVQYQDTVVGQGLDCVENKNLVTVKYRLTGGKFGRLIDSSNSFTFRVGKGEVIQGWDIGVQGMREGGRRRLVVPPKAGYGSQDIGAGPGAILNFDITLLKIVR
mmetsp:Transcript_25212/g.37239  ORF Transcript_25212/g.37239 Transcript_25212/m.37239 type:complete len:262 (-) Transcript_25212:107-892(-)|eukprot:CAMPEP_0194219334 /NCGR_PEP_ID=MMETSP0156-20130528/25708_1 /TAXON_ID=33649 /ORGANISM="Thalassionema nitzschioides, Strain L26-B" /LENGTH=261 /DNA_ID=CAMNT_0038948953 /DNA_START=76 /DNA_END=861 /DNA_ORIENTATION=-